MPTSVEKTEPGKSEKHDSNPTKSVHKAIPQKEVESICAIASRVDPVLFRDAMLCLAADGLTHAQFELIRRASTSAMTRKDGCPFCGTQSHSVATKASESTCRFCLKA